MAVEAAKPRMSIFGLFRRREQSLVQVQLEVELVAPVRIVKAREPDLSSPFAWRRRIEVTSQIGNLVQTKAGHKFEIDENGKAFGKTVYSLIPEDLK